MIYKQQVCRECLEWQHKVMKPSSKIEQTAKSIQQKINQKIPQKVHDMITESIKRMVQTVLLGSELTTKRHPIETMSLDRREQLIEKKIVTYQRTAMIEGAGTGAGGFWWAIADFPMLLSIKIKFLFDAAEIYGFHVHDYRERLYILHIFQVAFSSDQKRKEVFLNMKNWEDTVKNYPSLRNLNWKEFQQEYRDQIDLAKLFQLVPGFGAIVGAIANRRFLKHLGNTAKNAYRMRLLDFSKIQ